MVIIMKGKKTVHLIPKNHEFLRQLSFINNSSIELETNKIISNMRELKKVKIYVSKFKT